MALNNYCSIVFSLWYFILKSRHFLPLEITLITGIISHYETILE